MKIDSQIPEQFFGPFSQPFQLKEYKERLNEFAEWSKANFNLIPVYT